MVALMLRRLIVFLSMAGLASATCTTGASGKCEVGSGKTYATPSACSSVAAAGQTCLVFAGSYAGWTQVTSGTAGNPITFTANTGDTVNITSQINLSSRSYITISYLNLTQANGDAILGNNSTQHNIMDHLTSKTTLLDIPSGAGGGGSDNTVSYSIVDLSAHGDNTPGFNVYGDRNLFDHNEIKSGEGDCHDLGGTNLVIRYTSCHDINGASNEHIDFVQVIGGVAPTMSFSLLEHNTFQHCYNDGNNCHAMLLRNGPGFGSSDTVIFRYNYIQNVDGSGPSYGGAGNDSAPNGAIYNNTVNFSSLQTQNGGCAFLWDSPVATGAQVINNICYNTHTGPWSITGSTTSGLFGNGNIAYTTGYSGSWNAPYSNEATYSTLRNQNPLFANYPTDGTLQSGSPARGSGVRLTTVSSGCGTSSLVVGNSHFFQAGWGPSNNPAQGDWIRVGASTTVQISSITYASNTLTLANSIACSNGDSVYLYKDSSGTVVLSGANPDIGAYPFVGGGPAVTLNPTSLTFSSQNVGTTATEQTVTATNSGTSTLIINAPTYTGDYARGASTTCGDLAHQLLAPGDTCVIAAQFTPTFVGTRNGTMTITDNAVDSPQSVTLTGTGTLAPQLQGQGTFSGVGVVK